MKKFVLLFTSMFMVAFVFAQTNFQDLTLEKALEKAKTENKYVFVDCYTSWCGPCKMMATSILPLKEVGEYMNEHFVCVKFDMEKGEGRDIRVKYRVSSYPTFLVLKTDGSLLHVVVGGTATGEAFLAKVKEAFDENSAGKLEAEYNKGNRNLDFLMKYIEALVQSCDIDKARGISQDVLASLDDDEKCSAAYWFIYENRELSPVGSGNTMYLLKHVDRFRKGVGVEKVDAAVAGLFEVQLEDIIRGRNKNATLADIEAAEKQLESFHLTGQEYLNEYITLIKAVMKEDADETLRLCKEMFPKMSDEKIAYLYFSPITMLQDKWDKKQKKELTALTKQLEEHQNNRIRLNTQPIIHTTRLLFITFLLSYKPRDRNTFSTYRKMEKVLKRSQLLFISHLSQHRNSYTGKIIQ